MLFYRALDERYLRLLRQNDPLSVLALSASSPTLLEPLFELIMSWPFLKIFHFSSDHGGPLVARLIREHPGLKELKLTSTSPEICEALKDNQQIETLTLKDPCHESFVDALRVNRTIKSLVVNHVSNFDHLGRAIESSHSLECFRVEDSRDIPSHFMEHVANSRLKSFTSFIKVPTPFLTLCRNQTLTHLEVRVEGHDDLAEYVRTNKSVAYLGIVGLDDLMLSSLAKGFGENESITTLELVTKGDVTKGMNELMRVMTHRNRLHHLELLSCEMGTMEEVYRMLKDHTALRSLNLISMNNLYHPILYSCLKHNQTLEVLDLQDSTMSNWCSFFKALEHNRGLQTLRLTDCEFDCQDALVDVFKVNRTLRRVKYGKRLTSLEEIEKVNFVVEELGQYHRRSSMMRRNKRFWKWKAYGVVAHLFEFNANIVPDFVTPEMVETLTVCSPLTLLNYDCVSVILSYLY